MADKPALRSIFRKKRKQLNLGDQKNKALDLQALVIEMPLFNNSRHIAAYWPVDSEISPLPIVQYAYRTHIHCYLPKVDPLTNKLDFLSYKPDDPLIPNRYHILEPEPHQTLILPTDLDLVLVPLVAWDLKGHRLGMGIGSYDRTFAFLRNAPLTPKPYLLGIAYECQQANQLPQDPWDLPLNALATEKQIIHF